MDYYEFLLGIVDILDTSLASNSDEIQKTLNKVLEFVHTNWENVEYLDGVDMLEYLAVVTGYSLERLKGGYKNIYLNLTCALNEFYGGNYPIS